MKINIRRVLLLLLLLLTIFSCNREVSKIEIEELLNKKISNFTFENAKSFLIKNSSILDTIVSIYFGQSSIKTIIRRDKNNNLLSHDINYPDKDIVKYSIVCFSGKIFDVAINSLDYPKEKDFWYSNYNSIRNEKFPNDRLQEFVDQNKIDLGELIKLIEFMSTYQLSTITKSDENVYVKINFRILEGLIYTTKSASLGGKIESSTFINKIYDNWYYFKEDY